MTDREIKIAKWLVIILLIIIAFILGRCDRDKSLIPNVVYIKDTTTHSGINPIPAPTGNNTVYIVKWKDSINTVHDTVDKPILIIDSVMCVAIAKDYYTKYSYDRTLVDDSLLTFTLKDTTYMNKLQSSKYDYKINRPQTVIIHKQPRPIKVYGGVNVFYSKDIGFKPTAGVQVVTNRLTMFYGLGSKCQNFGLYVSF